MPSDGWDLDGIGGFIMADVQIEGKTRKVIMQAPKSGVFYILDRTNGQFISAEPFVPVNWATSFDKKNNGKPIIESRMPSTIRTRSVVIYPGGGGAHNWAPMSYNPNAGLVYLPYSGGYLQLRRGGGTESEQAAAARMGWVGRRPRPKTTPMPIWSHPSRASGPRLTAGSRSEDEHDQMGEAGTRRQHWRRHHDHGQQPGLFQVASQPEHRCSPTRRIRVRDLLGTTVPPRRRRSADHRTWSTTRSTSAFATGTQFLSFKVGGTAAMPTPPPAPAGRARAVPVQAKVPPPAPAKPWSHRRNCTAPTASSNRVTSVSATNRKVGSAFFF